MGKHAKLSPSSAYRWIACPGSIAMCEGMPDVASEYALEGSIAHKLAESSLKRMISPKKLVGETCKIGDKLHVFTEDMAEAVTVYYDEIYKAIEALKPDRIKVEDKFDLSWLENGLFGTNDVWLYSEANTTLMIADYKHGQGVEVEADNNPQLMIYALGALAAIEKPFDDMKVVLVIIQPRTRGEEKLKFWQTTAGALFTWATFILRPAIEATKAKKPKLCAGEHCRFCKAIAICPEVVKDICEVAKTDFIKPAFPMPDQLTVNDISKVLLASEMFSTWADQVRGYAQNRMEMGIKIPGFKLVNKKSNRVWKDEDKATEFLLLNLPEEVAFERKILSPAKAEKVLKGIDLDPLVFKPEAGVTIAAETDRRKAVNAPALADFIADENFLQ